MLKSNDVALGSLGASGVESGIWILEIGEGFRTIRLFSSRNLEMKRTVPLVLGIMKAPAAHSESFCFGSTPVWQRRSTSRRSGASWM